MTVEQIAQVAHEVNAAYCRTIGDDSQPSWLDAPEWQKASAISGVQFHIDNPDASESDSHDSWFAEKVADGWKHGKVKDAEKKEHPCMVPYEDLPVEQQVKDSLFIGVVRAMSYEDPDGREQRLVVACETLMFMVRNNIDDIKTEPVKDLQEFLSDAQEVLDASPFCYDPLTGKESVRAESCHQTTG